MKLKNIILGLGLSVLGLFAQAQNGLERIHVERYYVADAADAAAASGSVLPAGAVTFRIYADMRPDCKINSIYGSPQHTLKITTTTSFYNNGDYGATYPGFSAANAKKNAVMLDSWLSSGQACAGFIGVPKTEDDAVSLFVGPTGNTNGLLKNTVAPLYPNDGMFARTSPAVTFIGLDDVIGVFADGGTDGNSFIVTNGAWSNLSGSQGAFPSGSNEVLIAQITTIGDLHIELNIQIENATGGTEKYVVSNPAADEIVIPSLVQTLYAAPVTPLVSLTAPVAGATFTIGASVAIAANASDADGSVSQVQFFVDGVSVGIDASAPYTATYTGLAEAAHTLTAVATDNDGQTTTSAPVIFNIGNAPPVATITDPVEGEYYVVGMVVEVKATAVDSDGTVASLKFYNNGVLIPGVVSLSAGVYSQTFTSSVLGPNVLTAKATDNLGKEGPASAARTISVNANVFPDVAITAPAGGAILDVANDLVLTATASDFDGAIVLVQFFNGATLLGEGLYDGVLNAYTYTVPAASLVVGPMVLTAKATDDYAAVKTSATVNVTIKNFSVAYEIASVRQECYVGTTCMKVNTVASVSGVIGYNFTIAYDKTKVNPTGVVTVSPALLGGIAASQTSVDTYIDAAAGTIAVSIYFKGSAPVTAAFNGIGEICCVQFDQLPAFTGDATTTLSFTSPGVTESYPTLVSDVDGQAGTFEIFRDWFLFSNLKNWSDNQAIKYDPSLGHTGDYLVSNILGSSPQAGAAGAAVQPDLNGTFKYDIRNGLTIDIQRDILNSTLVNSVIEGNDAYLASRVSLGIPAATYTPAIYNIIAMDVNRDTRITAGDATQINRRSVNAIQEFTQVGGEHKDWLFVAKTVAEINPAYKISASYPQNDGVGYSRAKVPYISTLQNVIYNADFQVCPELLTSEDYLGVMLGDADETYEGIVNNGQIKSPAAEITSEIVIDLSKATIVDGNIQLPVSLKCAEAVNSYSFQLTLKENVQVNNIVSTVNANLDWNYVSEYKALLVSTYISGNTSIPTANTIANISVDGIASISINDLKGVTSKINGKDANVVIVDALLGVPEQGKDNLVKVYPNPATDRVNVQTSVDSKIKMFDFNGKQVVSEQNMKANELQSVDVSKLVPGVYMLKVYNDKFVKMQKVVIK